MAADSWPDLAFGSSNANDAGTVDDLTFDIENDGIGPARLETLQVFHKGTRQDSFPALLKAWCDTSGKKIGYATSAVLNRVLPARETTHVIRLKRGTNSALWDALNRERNQMDVLMCYCSVFDECWINDTRAKRTQRVEQCTQPEADNFKLY